jgi:pentatricopeptide repeat protein
MKEKGLQHNVFSYNALLSAYVVTKDPERGFEILEEMRDNNISANLGTYNILMELSAIEGRLDNVLKFFHLLINQKIRP